MGKKKDNHTRRAFLGWFSSIAAGMTFTFTFRYFYQGNKPRIPFLRESRKHVFHTAREARKKFQLRKAWDTKQLVINVSDNNESNIVHWPNRDLFTCRYRVALENQELVDVEDWKDAIKRDAIRFDKRKSGTILEKLALIELNSDSDGKVDSFTGLEEAIEILKYALSLPENHKNRRLVELLGRLTSLMYESDRNKAFLELEEMRKLFDVDPRRNRFYPQWLMREKEHESWHRKTTERIPNMYSFRNKLLNRVREAKELL